MKHQNFRTSNLNFPKNGRNATPTLAVRSLTDPNRFIRSQLHTLLNPLSKPRRPRFPPSLPRMILSSPSLTIETFGAPFRFPFACYGLIAASGTSIEGAIGDVGGAFSVAAVVVVFYAVAHRL